MTEQIPEWERDLIGDPLKHVEGLESLARKTRRYTDAGMIDDIAPRESGSGEYPLRGSQMVIDGAGRTRQVTVLLHEDGTITWSSGVSDG